jgi:hypothetical protein
MKWCGLGAAGPIKVQSRRRALAFVNVPRDRRYTRSSNDPDSQPGSTCGPMGRRLILVNNCFV